MRIRLLLFLILTFTLHFSAKATHIVGGEFELRHINENNYRLTLNLYFDDVNGSPGALDNDIQVNFFEKGSNKFITSLQMFLKSRTPVNYTNIECTIGSLSTSKIVYYEDITLHPNVFNNPQGYYVTWERCCRNKIINNIESPENAAQTFYMEFPPVVLNGAQFKNSSPILFPPLSDYACVNEPFYYEFNGTDPDGDSIVYDMVTPLNGYTTPDNPSNNNTQAQPAPYPLVNWVPGYSTNVQVQGNPSIKIDRNSGQLIMRPTSKGLFVFGVRAQEFRNGKKIGEVRRDFQVLVLDCPTNQAPVVMAKKPELQTFYKNGDIIRIKPNDTRCIDIFYSDPDKPEFISLRAKPVNFTSKGFNLDGQLSGIINQGVGSDSLKATICFEECFDTGGKIYQLDLIVQDDGCSLPKLDTVRLNLIIDPIPNAPPILTADKPAQQYKLQLNQPFDLNLEGVDTDLHDLTITADGEGFSLEELGMEFSAQGGKGLATGKFNWVANCLALEKGTIQVIFTLNEKACKVNNDQKITMEFLVEAPTLSSFIPANIFTPNGDGLNDYFEIPSLPENMCFGKFSNIKIFNRWGKEVFESQTNKFRWNGNGVNDGVYFYVIDFGSTTYRGTVTLVR